MAGRIMVVDDDPDVRNVLARYLTGEGWEVVATDDAAAAADGAAGCDLLLLDIRMPGVDGIDLLGRCRQTAPATEVIIITGHASMETAIRALEYGAFDYLLKPLDLDLLCRTARRALEKKRLVDENRRLLEELTDSNRRLADLARTLERRVEERTRELAESKEAAERGARRLATINEITRAVTSSLDLREVLRIVASETGKIIRFDRASITLTDGLRSVNKVYFLKPAPEGEPEDGAPFPIGGTGIERVIRTGEPLIRDGLDTAAVFPEDEFIRATGMRSGIVLPLISRGVPIGTFNLGSAEAGAYGAEDGAVLRQIAGQIAIAIENADLYRRLRQYSDSLESMVARRTEDLQRSIAELRAAQDRLVQSEKLAATSKLIAGVAHEIKNPLNSMAFATANIEKALSSPLDRKKALALCRENLSILRSDIARLGEMVNAFMSFTKPVRVQREAADPNEIVREVVRRLGPELAAKRIGLDERYDPAVPRLMLERDPFHRALLNLLLNARDAAPRGGAIRLSTRRAGGRVEIEVADDGCGIPPEIRDRVFDIFFTTKAEGAGLGLAQVYRTVESHGGTITFRSEVGGGTTFLISLPAG
ncbi:MAG: response regulator [bacterium]|nr:response regulator [bacterium]